MGWVIRSAVILCFILWFSNFLLTVTDQLDDMRIAKLEFKNSNQHVPSISMNEVNVSWLSYHFKPHAMSCGWKDIFVANKYQIIRISQDDGKVYPVPCALRGMIADVAATCDGQGECSPLVLLQGNTSRIVDCASGVELSLGDELSPAVGFALHQIKPLVRDPLSSISLSAPEAIQRGGMTVLHQDGALVEYGPATNGSGWDPLWEVANVGLGVQAIDVDSAARHFLLFRQSRKNGSPNSTDARTSIASTVEVKMTGSLRSKGVWHLLPDTKPFQAGCVTNKTTLWVIPQGRTPSLLRGVMPSITHS